MASRNFTKESILNRVKYLAGKFIAEKAEERYEKSGRLSRKEIVNFLDGEGYNPGTVRGTADNILRVFVSRKILQRLSRGEYTFLTPDIQPNDCRE